MERSGIVAEAPPPPFLPPYAREKVDLYASISFFQRRSGSFGGMVKSRELLFLFPPDVSGQRFDLITSVRFFTTSYSPLPSHSPLGVPQSSWCFLDVARSRIGSPLSFLPTFFLASDPVDIQFFQSRDGGSQKHFFPFFVLHATPSERDCFSIPLRVF